MTHDLIKNILESLDARVQKVVVNDLRENTFYAVLHLRLGNADITVDSRPSDAIALALRVGAPIFVEEDVVREGPHRRGRQGDRDRHRQGRRPGQDQGVARVPQAGRLRRIERDKDPKSPDE